MKAAERSKRFYTDLRRHLKEIVPGMGGWNAVGDLVGIKGNTLLSFFLGRSKGLTEETLAALDHHGLLPEITEPEEDREPLAEWTGETKTTRQAIAEKGYTGATLRKMCKDGRLDYQMTESGRYQIVVNDKYQALPITAMAALREENQQLRDRVAELESKLEEMQLEFAWEQPATEADSDANLKIAEVSQFSSECDCGRINSEPGATAPSCICQESGDC